MTTVSVVPMAFANRESNQPTGSALRTWMSVSWTWRRLRFQIPDKCQQSFRASRKISTLLAIDTIRPSVCAAIDIRRERKPTPCTTPRTRMNNLAFLLHIHEATAALPADLDHLASSTKYGTRVVPQPIAACGHGQRVVASTSYSTKSQRFHSNHSRIS